MHTTLDVLIVGAGFAGLHTLYKLRTLGFNVKIFEAGSDLGGVWHWNRYPGARVDSESPVYQLQFDKKLWEEFEFSERCPSRDEIQSYFQHVDKLLDLRKDIQFNTTVTAADWNEQDKTWTVAAANLEKVKARFLVLCLGFAAKSYTPAFKGIDLFKGDLFHSSRWPDKQIDLSKKRVAVIGTGASGVQLIQTIGPIVQHLTVYQRAPNTALPMRQVSIQDKDKPKNLPHEYTFAERGDYEGVFKRLQAQFAGIMNDKDYQTKKFSEVFPAERQVIYEQCWTYGGFGLWLTSFQEMLFEQEANDEVYAFWANKVRARIEDPKMKDLLAPLKPKYPIFTKRPSLEINYYEVFNQSNVNLIDVNESPILEIAAEGIRTEREGLIRLDLIVFATGFDTMTGGILDIKITAGGKTLKGKWEQGVQTYLGFCSAGFPNLFWIYGPQAPTAFANGPTAATIQGDWLVDLLDELKRTGKNIIEAKEEFEVEWTKLVRFAWGKTIFPGKRNWWDGSNIPGKRIEALNYAEGIPAYVQRLKEAKDNHYNGFNIQ